MRFLTQQFLKSLEHCTDKIHRHNVYETRKGCSIGASWSDWVTKCHCNAQHTATHFTILRHTALPTAPPAVSEWLSHVLACCMRWCRGLVAPLNCHVAFWKRNLHKRAPLDRAEFPLIWHVSIATAFEKLLLIRLKFLIFLSWQFWIIVRILIYAYIYICIYIFM